MNLVLEEIGNKNEKVFKNFFDKHYRELVLYANGYLFDKEASEDITQEVFIYLWEHSKELNIDRSLKSYLYAMVKNKCLNYLKSIKITDSFELLDFNMILSLEQDVNVASVDKAIVYHQVLKIIDTLPKKMQEIVKLKFLNNYKYAEIANELGVSTNTVKTQLKRAKFKITESVAVLLILLQSN